MKKILRYLLIIVLLAALFIAGFFTYFRVAYPKDGPVVEVTLPKNDTAAIARGKYLVDNIAGCVDCHSPRSFAYFGVPIITDSAGKGGLAFTHELGFPGTIFAKNITPEGIGSWTDAQLYHTVTTGVNPNGIVLFPVMPYNHFGKMDPEDVKDILAYIRTLKPQKGNYPDHDIDFPVSLFIRTAPAPASPVKRPLPSDTLKYGQYLFNMAACEDCHTPMKNGDPIPGLEMAGGFEFKLHGMGTVRSANITPDPETGIGNWTKEMFIETFKSYQKPENQVIPWQKRNYQTVMPWIEHSGMTRDDLAALYKYLRSLKPVKHRVQKWTPWNEQTASK